MVRRRTLESPMLDRPATSLESPIVRSTDIKPPLSRPSGNCHNSVSHIQASQRTQNSDGNRSRDVKPVGMSSLPPPSKYFNEEGSAPSDENSACEAATVESAESSISVELALEVEKSKSVEEVDMWSSLTQIFSKGLNAVRVMFCQTNGNNCLPEYQQHYQGQQDGVSLPADRELDAITPVVGLSISSVDNLSDKRQERKRSPCSATESSEFLPILETQLEQEAQQDSDDQKQSEPEDGNRSPLDNMVEGTDFPNLGRKQSGEKLEQEEQQDSDDHKQSEPEDGNRSPPDNMAEGAGIPNLGRKQSGERLEQEEQQGSDDHEQSELEDGNRSPPDMMVEGTDLPILGRKQSGEKLEQEEQQGSDDHEQSELEDGNRSPPDMMVEGTDLPILGRKQLGEKLGQEEQQDSVDQKQSEPEAGYRSPPDNMVEGTDFPSLGRKQSGEKIPRKWWFRRFSPRVRPIEKLSSTGTERKVLNVVRMRLRNLQKPKSVKSNAPEKKPQPCTGVDDKEKRLNTGIFKRYRLKRMSRQKTNRSPVVLPEVDVLPCLLKEESNDRNSDLDDGITDLPQRQGRDNVHQTLQYNEAETATLVLPDGAYLQRTTVLPHSKESALLAHSEASSQTQTIRISHVTSNQCCSPRNNGSPHSHGSPHSCGSPQHIDSTGQCVCARHSPQHHLPPLHIPSLTLSLLADNLSTAADYRSANGAPPGSGKFPLAYLLVPPIDKGWNNPAQEHLERSVDSSLAMARPRTVTAMPVMEFEWSQGDQARRTESASTFSEPDGKARSFGGETFYTFTSFNTYNTAAEDSSMAVAEGYCRGSVEVTQEFTEDLSSLCCSPVSTEFRICESSDTWRE